MTDTDMLYMASLQKRLDEVETENAELRARVSELEGKHWNECGQIAHYSDELRQAKELLKAAVEDFKVIGKALDADCDILINCEECPLQSGHYNCRSWNHQDEALALIGEDTNVPASADDTNVGGKTDSWISCKERMPEDNDRVLILAKNESVYIAKHRVFGHFVVSFEYWLDDTEVTHWMPLPEPPKDGSGGRGDDDEHKT